MSILKRTKGYSGLNFFDTIVVTDKKMIPWYTIYSKLSDSVHATAALHQMRPIMVNGVDHPMLPWHSRTNEVRQVLNLAIGIQLEGMKSFRHICKQLDSVEMIIDAFDRDFRSVVVK